MAVFVNHPCNIDLETIVDNAVWSNTDPIAALASSRLDDKNKEKFQVLFVNHEGGLILNSIINHDAPARVMEWQPNGRILAIGWGDGMVSCWNVDGKTRPTSTFSGSSQHNAPITVIKWNPAGKRLITGDKNGTVNVWVVDSRGTLTPSRQYRKRSHVTAAVFCVIPTKAESGRKTDPKKTHSPAFFFGTDRGGVVYADDLGHCTEVQSLSSAVDKMLFYEEKSRLVIITRSLLLTQYHVSEDGRVTRVMQVKLSVAKDVADSGIRSVVWAGPGLLAIATSEKMVRLLDLSSDESYNLSLSSVGDGVDKNDRVVAVAFSPVDRYLAVGTQMGLVVVWKYSSLRKRAPSNDEDEESSSAGMAISQSDWELHYSTNINTPVRSILWGSSQGTMIVSAENSTIVLSEAVMQLGRCGVLSVVQLSTMHVSVHVGTEDDWIENTRILVRGLSVADSSFVVWDGKTARVCTVNMQTHRSSLVEPFACTSQSIVIADSQHLSDEALFLTDGGVVRVANYSGVPKGTITFSEAEGHPKHLHICGKFLYVVTSRFYVKVFDVNKPSTPRLMGSVGRFIDNSSDKPTSTSNLIIRSIRGNSTGSRVAILTSHVEGSLKVQHPDTRLHIFDRIKGSTMVFDFAEQSRYPKSAYWDNFDDRLIVVEAVRMHSSVMVAPVSKEMSTDPVDRRGSSDSLEVNPAEGRTVTVEGENEFEILLLFASSEHGIMLQDSYPRAPTHGDLLGIDVPNVYFRNAIQAQTSAEGDQGPRNSVKVFAKVMRDFVGVTKIDDTTKFALIEFSFNLTLGRLDEAYRAVKAIDSPFIWENMAQMCVKTKRLDVAEVCLGNMGHARGAAALRDSLKDNNPDVSIGVLAIQLGLLDDAARLFRESGRYDMLNTLYQAAGLWDKAIGLAKSNDRIHLKTTHYHYAKYLESIGEMNDAIFHYEQSETSRTEVPRMLYTLGQIEELEDYVHKSNDTALLKWWAAYLESKERYDKAKKYYARAGDYLSLVRILCFQGDFKKAAEIVSETQDAAATYHFARQLEVQGELQEAIGFYADSGCYNHAIRLAKAYGMDAELMTFAIKSTPSLMLDTASHFEQKGDLEKAVQLYHKGGDYLHALDICFRVGQGEGNVSKQQKSAMFDMVNIIAQDLGADTSPQILARCAEFLVMHKQFEKAIELYVMARRYLPAIEMCIQHKVAINDEMADLLTPPSEKFDTNERKEILGHLGRALKKDGSFLLASKKYTQAGDRIRAIKCLLRSGDTKAVIQFASISRNAEIYKLAANYLQQMDWRDGEIMKSIITFYSKAKAYEQLSGFYDSCAQVEIDEYRDYEKAFRALKESMKYLKEAKGHHIQDMVSALQARLNLIERFVEARKCAKTDPEEMVSICENILEEPQLDLAIRVGDCLAMLVEHFHSAGNMKLSYQYMLDMKERGILLDPYIDAEVLEDVHRALGIPMQHEEDSKGQGRESHVHNRDVDDDDDDIGEDIEEEVEEDEDEEDPRQRRGGGGYGQAKYRK